MSTKDTPTPRDLAAVDEAARVLAKAARALGIESLELRIWGDGSGEFIGEGAEDFEEGFDLESRGENDPAVMPSTALARRLGVATDEPATKLRPLTTIEHTILVAMSGGADVWKDGYEGMRLSDAAGAVSRLESKGYVEHVGRGSREITVGGRVYLATSNAPLTAIERSVLGDVAFSVSQTTTIKDDIARAAAFQRLHARGLVQWNGDRPELTPAGRAYLAGAAAGPSTAANKEE